MVGRKKGRAAVGPKAVFDGTGVLVVGEGKGSGGVEVVVDVGEGERAGGVGGGVEEGVGGAVVVEAVLAERRGDAASGGGDGGVLPEGLAVADACALRQGPGRRHLRYAIGGVLIFYSSLVHLFLNSSSSPSVVLSAWTVDVVFPKVFWVWSFGMGEGRRQRRRNRGRNWGAERREEREAESHEERRGKGGG